MEESRGQYTAVNLIDLDVWLRNEKVTNPVLGDNI